MLKKIWVAALFFLSLQSLSSQINFEEGYFVTNNGEKNHCLIKNEDWKNNPSSFQYKNKEEDSPQEALISNIQEFNIKNGPRYIRKSIAINRSSFQTSELEQNRSVSFKNEQLFLKELVAGPAKLYSYEDQNLIRFFYSVKEGEMEPLVYKKYRKENMQIGENNQYKQQLLNSMKCSQITPTKIQRLRYKREALINIFNDFNQCLDPSYTPEQLEKSKFKFLIAANVGINMASLFISNGPFALRSTDFGSGIGFRAGVELESFLPFNKNKWSLFVEPTYQFFKKEGYTNPSILYNSSIQANVDYASIEFPFGFRHYSYLNNNNSLFLDAAIVFDYDLDSKITFENNTELNIDAWGNWRAGVGYKFKDKLRLQLRYFSPRDLLDKYKTWQSDYKVYSVILGYTF
ncbi:tRNA modification GTPase [Maribacter sp. PR1]|uniref:tRNA modification GTPase n=1 Tax=Maribacter cobaltidurans TaxID=1178778 RepID=A0ABU7IS40_9FLAO|nr:MULTISPECIES: tRNA modification GTPase [Maribacter]MDC6388399.1 tRNA modification GTPase [Maribacter sp. PR1]MEE1975788.1 tRNA modification GTPase [Maribacter cobaltidurans]